MPSRRRFAEMCAYVERVSAVLLYRVLGDEAGDYSESTDVVFLRLMLCTFACASTLKAETIANATVPRHNAAALLSQFERENGFKALKSFRVCRPRAPIQPS